MHDAELSARAARSRGGPTTKWCRRRVLERFGSLEHGGLELSDGRERWMLGRAGGRVGRVEVRDPAFWRMLVTGGSVGAGEAYVAGLWDSPELVDVIRVLAANRDLLARMDEGAARLYGGLLRVVHRFHRNSIEGSRRNISAHYDLGNDFFASWLDARMQYSSALYRSASDSLDAAQENKLARICDRLALGPGDHLLEIGTGWGGLAEYAAHRTGCRVTTTTISREQFDFAKRRIAEAGLDDRVEVLLRDYRDLEGRYDKLVSVEMIEAVGAEYLDTYLATVSDRLKPEGLALIQAITIEDFRYREALSSVDFIKRYIFPGSFIPSISAITASMGRASDLGLLELFDMGDSYARTLAAWRERFEAAWRNNDFGFDEAFRRRWRYYLAYCEGGFAERAISDVQLLLARPGYRKAAG